MREEEQQYREECKLEIAMNIVSLIKYNSCIQHLNLSNTGLDAFIIHTIVDKALNKARSLLSLHLSGNPGVTNDNIEFIRERGKCRLVEDTVTVYFEEGEKKSKKKLIEEHLKLKHIKQSICATSNTHKMATNFAENKLVVFRQMGHKYEMPGSNQWQMHTDPLAPHINCWICD